MTNPLGPDGLGTYDDANTFAVGDRVEFHPGTDLWMTGARYGTVEAFQDLARPLTPGTDRYYVVKPDRHGLHAVVVPADRIRRVA